MTKRKVLDTLYVVVSVFSVVVLFYVLFTYHPAESPRPPATCGYDTLGPAYGEPRMPAGMLAKENSQ